MQKGIAIAGNLIVDYIKYIENYPARHALTTITGSARSTGGLCSNCSLTLAKLDESLPVIAIGLVGQDEAGDYVLSQLAALHNIDTSRILRQGETSYTDVMTESATGGRTFFQFRGANALLSPEHFRFDNLDADILHIGYILLLDALDAPDDDYPTVMCRVLDNARKAGIRTSIDVVSEDGERFSRFVPPALKYTDYCIINEMEASRTTGIKLRDEHGGYGEHDKNSGNGGHDKHSGQGEHDEYDGQSNLLIDNLPAACSKLMDMGVGRWAVIHAPEFSCGLERGGDYILKPSWKLPPGFIKSSVGAGDAFASGILYGAYHNWSLEKSIHTAGAVAAYSLSGAGACDAIKPLPDILKEMESYQ